MPTASVNVTTSSIWIRYQSIVNRRSFNQGGRRVHDDAGRDRLGLFRVEIRVAADRRRDRVLVEIRQRRRRYALRDAQRLDLLAVRAGALLTSYMALSSVAKSAMPAVPGRNNSKIDGTRTARW